MATIGGVLLSGGLVDGYRISEIAATANSALSTANKAKEAADDVTKDLKNYSKKGHTHGIPKQTRSTGYGGEDYHTHSYAWVDNNTNKDN